MRSARPGDPTVDWLRQQPRDGQYFSAVSLMELRYGAELAGGVKGEDLSRWIAEHVLQWFVGATLSIGDETLLIWRRLLQRLRQAGKPIGEPDSLIAATALEHNLILVTRDVRAFVACEVPVLNPWTQELHPPGRSPLKLRGASLDEALRALRRTR